MTRSGFTDDFRRNFLTGVAAFFPVILTLFLFSWVFRQIHTIIGPSANAVCGRLIAWFPAAFSLFFPGASEVQAATAAERLLYAEAHFPRVVGTIVGLIAAAVFVYLMGVMLRGYIGRRVVQAVDRFFERFPVIKAVYPHARQLADLVFRQTPRRQFSRVVAVQYPRRGVYSLGFRTSEGLAAFESVSGRKLVTVFVPTSPTPLTGFIIQLPPDEVEYLDMSVDEAFRFCISAGMLTSGKQQEDEALQEVTDVAGVTLPRAAAAPGKVAREGEDVSTSGTGQ